MSHEQPTTDVIEKRRFLRLKDYFKVTFRITDDFGTVADNADLHVGYSKDLSLGGVGFVTDIDMERGQVVAASISIPEIDTPVEFIGEVVRSIPLSDNRFEVAFKFLPFGLDEDRRSELELFIYEHFLKDPLA
ncbi:MAG: PilZ domain-containing protein [Planctomycetota bacterium]